MPKFFGFLVQIKVEMIYKKVLVRARNFYTKIMNRNAILFY